MITPTMPFELTTSRLLLRTFREDDWKALHVIYSDPACTEYTIKRVLTEGESWRMLAALVGHWQLRGYGPYAVTRKSDGIVMGIAGLWFPIEWPEPEIKWVFAKEFWGQGYACEAAMAVREMAAATNPDLHLISLILPENTRSIHLAERMGASFENEVVFRGGKARIYRHLAPRDV